MKLFLLSFLFVSFVSVASAGDFRGPAYDRYQELGSQTQLPPGTTLQRLITLTSDTNKNVNYLHLMFDANRNISGMFNEDAPGNEIEKDAGTGIFTLAEIESKRGGLLKKSRGYEAIFLLGKLDRNTLEGKFTIRYLANGLFTRYATCDFFLKRVPGQNSWYVQNAYNGKPVTEIFVETYSLGIETIHGICPK